MAVLATNTHTLLDITRTLGPDGKQMKIAEILSKDNEGVINDMTWKEGNLITGDRHAQRAGLPTVGWRRLNAGVARSKAVNRAVDETAAMLEANSSVDRKLAILAPEGSAAYRLGQAAAFLESMKQEFTQTLFYGNAALADEEFTGLTPRFNSLSGPYADQIIDAGGTGTDNRSIWIIGWDQDKVTGIFPKGTIGGLHHMDTTSNLRLADDGHPIGDEIEDGLGRPYQGYKDHWEWMCGLAVMDARYVVRIANIDVSLLAADMTTGAKLQQLLVMAMERVQGRTANMAIYAPRGISTMLRLQVLNAKNAFLSLDEIAGRKVTVFDGVPIRRTDELEVDEARVV